jgi:NAD(P)-dependent dehydrogenase (short-subunit alcohol dehydrogenase family)
MTFDLVDQVAIVTGGAGGIGEALAMGLGVPGWPMRIQGSSVNSHV